MTIHKYKRKKYDDTTIDVIGFKNLKCNADEQFVRGTRRIVAFSMERAGYSLDQIKEVLGLEATIIQPSTAFLKEQTVTALNAVRTDRNEEEIRDAISIIRLPQVQQICLTPFDEQHDTEYIYQIEEGKPVSHVASRRGYFSPKTGQPTPPHVGELYRTFISVGEYPRNTMFRHDPQSSPTPSQLRHQNWRDEVRTQSLALKANDVASFRIVSVYQILTRHGSRAEIETVFYVEGYSFWSQGSSKMRTPLPAEEGFIPSEHAEKGNQEESLTL